MAVISGGGGVGGGGSDGSGGISKAMYNSSNTPPILPPIPPPFPPLKRHRGKKYWSIKEGVTLTHDDYGG